MTRSIPFCKSTLRATLAPCLCMLTMLTTMLILACVGPAVTVSPEITVPPSPMPTPTPRETAIPTQDANDARAGGNSFAQSPTVVLIDTVVSLSRNSDVPDINDTAVIRIDAISSIDNPFGWELEGLQEGNDIQVGFTYTSRPARIRVLPVSERTGTAGGDQQTVHFDLASEKSGRIEGGFLVYEYQHSSVEQVTETVLPGLEVGSKFATTISYSSPTRISVGE